MRHLAFAAVAVVAFGAAPAMADELTCTVDEVDATSGEFTCGNVPFEWDENVIGLTADQLTVGESVTITYQYQKGGGNDIVSIEKAG